MIKVTIQATAMRSTLVFREYTVLPFDFGEFDQKSGGHIDDDERQ